MCSIAGWISATPLNEEIAQRLARALLCFGQARGNQSAGILYGNRLRKRAMKPEEFVYTPEFNAAFKHPSTTCLLHTRMPTSGGRDDPDAQPFRSGPATIVHNGGFYNCGELKTKFSLEKTTQVDSELLASFVATHGAERLPDFLTTATGCAAVAAIDRGSLYLVRDGNPIETFTIQESGSNNVITVFGSTDSQVMNAVRHVWLFHNNEHASSLKEGQLFRIGAGTQTPIGTSFKRSYTKNWVGSTWNPETKSYSVADDDWGDRFLGSHCGAGFSRKKGKHKAPTGTQHWRMIDGEWWLYRNGALEKAPYPPFRKEVENDQATVRAEAKATGTGTQGSASKEPPKEGPPSA